MKHYEFLETNYHLLGDTCYLLELFTIHPSSSLFSLSSISTFPSKPKSSQMNFWIYNTYE